MARDPGETNSFITVDHDVLCYWLTPPSPPTTTSNLSEYLINPSTLNNSQCIVNFSISAGKLEQKHEDEGQGDLYCRKIVISTHWNVGREWKGGLRRLNPFLNTSSVLVHSDKYIFFLNFSFPFTALRISFHWAVLGVIYQGNDEKSSSNGKFWWIQQRENNAGVIVLPAGLRWHQGGT